MSENTNLKIIGMGRGVPDRRVFNDELAGFLDTDDSWISSRTGIKSRYVCTYETLTELSVTASRQALSKAGLEAHNIDLVLCVTLGGDYVTPSLACSVAEQISATCPAFDINAACTGFVYALDVASVYLAAGRAKNILIICAEMMSSLVDWNDRNTCILFGDGAAACVVTVGDFIKYMSLSTIADTSILNLPSGSGNSPFIKSKKEKGFLQMQGQEVFKFAVNVVERDLLQALDALDMALEQIDWFLLHQANKRIINSISRKLRQPEDKFPVNIDKYGNLSSVSIPLLLDEMLDEGKIKSGDTLFLSAFGAGLTAGSCIMVWE
ncbi:MAG: ketoacyl-ACP synthase III [Oscillospiraceae bacterium]|jgi:3-oxoacyl-[acyl-carrier-protein] synthase-3|nr:ketoacyl-ACP synthase III [Oscillospiraceae bacterium]